MNNYTPSTQRQLKYLLCGNYFLFAILLNSVGTVILKVIADYHVSPSAASSLEAYKDISIALFSLIIASKITKLGHLRAMVIGLCLVSAICFITPLMNSFEVTKLFFIVIGVSFVLIKISTYALVGEITHNEKEHASFMSIIEGIFMLGWLSGYFLFGYFIANEQSGRFNWLDTYWVLAVLSTIAALAMYWLMRQNQPYPTQSKSDKQASDKEQWAYLYHLVKTPLVQIFTVCVFLYVFIEQGIATWLPSFNHQTLNLPAALAVQTTAILAATSAIGRLIAGVLLRKIDWLKLLMFSLAGASVIILFIPFTIDWMVSIPFTSYTLPGAALIIPLIGFFLAPIYPTLCSTVLSSCPLHKQGALTGLIIIFSALGGTLGSRITGMIFGSADGYTAITATFIPIMVLLIALYPFKLLRKPRAFNP